MRDTFVIGFSMIQNNRPSKLCFVLFLVSFDNIIIFFNIFAIKSYIRSMAGADVRGTATAPAARLAALRGSFAMIMRKTMSDKNIIV